MKKQPNTKGLASSGTPMTDPPTETPRKEGAVATGGSNFTAYDVFEKCIERAQNLIKIHEAAHGKRAKPERYLADAHRASVVLSISALDAFVRTLAMAKIKDRLVNPKSQLPAPLITQIKKFIKDDELLEAARKYDLHERVEKAFTNDFERRSFQGTRNITECLEMAGYIDVFHIVAKKAQLNEESLRDNLDRFTGRRHVIAHRGDYDLSQLPPCENVITKTDAEECIKLVTKIAQTINSLE